MTREDADKLSKLCESCLIDESHFYHSMDRDMKNQYYEEIKKSIDPFTSLCHQIAIDVQRLKHQVEGLFYTDEWNNLKEAIENYTEDPKTEIREIQGHLLNVRDRLNHSMDDLSEYQIFQYLVDILTGEKIQ